MVNSARLTCLLLSLAAGSQAQAANWVIDQFDAPPLGSYTDQRWGTATPSLTWMTHNAPTTLATNTPSSGSLGCNIPWTTTGDQVMVVHPLGATINLNQYSRLSYDIQFDASSATDGNGSFGALEIDWVPTADGWPSTANPPQAFVTFSSANTNWMHVSMLVATAGNARLASVNGLGFKMQQQRTGANLQGTTSFRLDNVILEGLGPLALVQLNAAQLWQRLEFQIANIPAVGNPFDPETIRLDGTFTLPSGRTTVVPAFWFQDFQRSLSGGQEIDTAVGDPGWRLRFTPTEAGTYALRVTVQTNGQVLATLSTNFVVSASALPSRYGYVRTGTNHQYFQTDDGRALPLVGLDLAWPSGAGTYDYDTWFGLLHSAGGNFARLWMSPWSFGIEDSPHTLTNYAQAPAWQLDYVFQQAEQHGIYLQPALIWHGMFVTQPDYWGGGNYWPQNPYCVTNGGPCVNPNAFFTNAVAKTLFQKRLRYLVGRYGYSTSLLAWEFFNEIDNDYAFLSSSAVAAWHGEMGDWFHTNDPFGHLRTTSLTYASSHPEIWSLGQMDFTCEHAYTMSASPLNIASDAQSFLLTYRKPLLIGEFGTSWQGWNRSADPYLRGFREGIWAGALGGSAGTSMAWWWQNIASENDYSVYAGLTAILGRTGWGGGSWTNLTLRSGQTQFRALGQRGAHETLLYLVATGAIFPTGATNATLPLQHHQTLTLANWPAGVFYAEWHDPQSGVLLGTSQATAGGGSLTLPLPDYTVDLAGIVYPAPTLSAPRINGAGHLAFELNSETGGCYSLLESSDLHSWTTVARLTNLTGSMTITAPDPALAPGAFFRVEHTAQ